MEWLIGLLVAVVLIVVAVVFFRPGARRRSEARHRLAEAQAAAGPQACQQACSCLEATAASGDSRLVVTIWSELEPILLAALPDCPPDLKPRLQAALEACHAVCRHRETQRALMNLSRSLVPNGGP